ncbi:MAG: 4Fe-4S binding protein [Anaerolineales bacterium]|nr:4Fe-4S binding protein [Anaerolineales bacterium]
MATCGLATGAGAVYQALRERAGELDLDVMIVPVGCIGYCQKEPLVDASLPGVGRLLYAGVTPKSARQLVDALAEGHLPREGALALIPGDGASAKAAPDFPGIPALDELPFYARQRKIILRNCGWIDPVNIQEYIARDGYQALAKALLELTPQEVIDQVSLAGLRGRGGGGFPTGRKWQICHDAPGQPKYVICNGDEGDPGAYMDRTVLESDPYSVIEGLTLAAYAIGAQEGVVYVRDEYPLAVERVTQAEAHARELGLLGENILGAGFDFQITIVRGAGAFVCGEETALIASIEGGMGEPRSKPPYPATCGLWGKPTIINNVKTLATAPAIIHQGADWYASIGVAGNAGTVVFSLVGKVANTGLVEVPLGLSLREMIEGIGGGGLDHKTVKAVQTGGPSGGCLPARLFDLPISYEALTEAGSIMGSGGMVVMDEETCMVDVARYFLAFTMDESCGQCTPCREGTRFMHQILTRIVEGQGAPSDLQILQEVAGWVKATSLCGLGQTAPNPVLSTLRYFYDEYEAHVLEKRCPAGVCRALIQLVIQPEICTGCGLCLRECPGGAIRGEPKKPHSIEQELCTHCRICYQICPVEGAIELVH